MKEVSESINSKLNDNSVNRLKEKLLEVFLFVSYILAHFVPYSQCCRQWRQPCQLIKMAVTPQGELCSVKPRSKCLHENHQVLLLLKSICCWGAQMLISISWGGHRRSLYMSVCGCETNEWMCELSGYNWSICTPCPLLIVTFPSPVPPTPRPLLMHRPT